MSARDQQRCLSPVVIQPPGEGVELHRSYFDAASGRLLVAGSVKNFLSANSGLFVLDFDTGESQFKPIAAPFEVMSIGAMGLSRDGNFLFGRMQTARTQATIGEGFVVPIADLGNPMLVGCLPNRQPLSVVTCMSATGVAGVCCGTDVAALWDQHNGLRALPTPTEGISAVNAITADGAVCFGSFRAAPNSGVRAGFWYEGTATVLDARAQLMLGSANACDARGRIAGGRCGGWATVWKGGKQTVLPLADGSTWSEVRDVTDSGFCVGNTHCGSFLWSFGWRRVYSIREYTRLVTDTDIGIELIEAKGLTEHDGMLYVTGRTNRGGVALRLPARSEL